MPEETFIYIVGGIAMVTGLAGGLLQKIVWDWLNRRKGNINGEHCKDHHDCLARMNAADVCLNHVKRDVATDSAKSEERWEYIKSRLEQGDKKMNVMSGSIQSIDKSLVRLVTVVEERMHRDPSARERRTDAHIS